MGALCKRDYGTMLTTPVQVAYYAENNALLPQTDGRMLWEHFVLEGQFEARPFRFRCPEEGGAGDEAGGKSGGSGSGGGGRLRKREVEEAVTPDSLVASALRGAHGLLVGNLTLSGFTGL